MGMQAAGKVRLVEWSRQLRKEATVTPQGPGIIMRKIARHNSIEEVSANLFCDGEQYYEFEMPDTLGHYTVYPPALSLGRLMYNVAVRDEEGGVARSFVVDDRVVRTVERSGNYFAGPMPVGDGYAFTFWEVIGDRNVQASVDWNGRIMGPYDRVNDLCAPGDMGLMTHPYPDITAIIPTGGNKPTFIAQQGEARFAVFGTKEGDRSLRVPSTLTPPFKLQSDGSLSYPAQRRNSWFGRIFGPDWVDCEASIEG